MASVVAAANVDYNLTDYRLALIVDTAVDVLANYVDQNGFILLAVGPVQGWSIDRRDRRNIMIQINVLTRILLELDFHAVVAMAP